MYLRFYIDPDTDQPHIYDHNVNEIDVQDALRKPLETVKGRGKTMVAIGQTRGGRYLRVIYQPDEDDESLFVITAYDLPPRQIRALRRRRN